MSSTASASLLLYVVNMARLASLRRLVLLLLGRAYARTRPTMLAILIPPPRVGRVVVIIRIPVRRSMARVRHRPVKRRRVPVLLPPQRGVGASVPNRFAVHRARRLVTSVRSVRTMASNSHAVS